MVRTNAAIMGRKCGEKANRKREKQSSQMGSKWEVGMIKMPHRSISEWGGKWEKIKSNISDNQLLISEWD